MTPITLSFIAGAAVPVVIIMISGCNIRQEESWPALPKYGECEAQQSYCSIDLRSFDLVLTQSSNFEPAP